MSASISLAKQNRGTISHTNLVVMAFASAFFPRVLELVGFPAIVNFLHFAILPVVTAFIVSKTRTKDPQKIAITQDLLLGVVFFFTVIAASAFLNNAGAINIILDFLLLAEPFLLLLAIISIPMSEASIKKLHNWLLIFGSINLLFALIQGLVLRLDRINVDLVKGVFLGQGSGHVVGGSVSMLFATYFLFTNKKTNLFVSVLLVAATLTHLVKADAKQVFAIFLAALVILIIINSRDIANTIQYLAVAVVFTLIIVWLANTVFPSLNTWANLEVQIEGMELKSTAIPVTISEFKSPLNWLLGLGPGHTVGRLGGWMIEKYYNLLSPLGITFSRVSGRVWDITANHRLGDKSSWFSPLFGWAGIWGDLGFLGLGSYLYLWAKIWQKLCFDDLTKFVVINILCFGFIMSQIEEPGYMLYIACIIGLSWQRYRHQQLELAARESGFSRS